jgi:hypothetical protein
MRIRREICKYVLTPLHAHCVESQLHAMLYSEESQLCAMPPITESRLLAMRHRATRMESAQIWNLLINAPKFIPLSHNGS